MSIDWRRMEWQYWVNRGSEIASIMAAIMAAPEITLGLRYHFPLWDDIMMPATLGVFLIARITRRYTSMYRVDL